MKNKKIEKFDLFFFAVTVILILIFAVFAKAQSEQISAPKIVASGGAFTLKKKAVVAGGGSRMSNQPIVQNGTAGQSIAGVRSSAGQFSLYSGFWTPDDFVPTAATAVVGGRIKTAQGRGIKNVHVTITKSLILSGKKIMKRSQ